MAVAIGNRQYPSWEDTGSRPSGKGSMAIWFYAVSRRVIVLEKINVWGRLVLVVMAATLGTETVGASKPVVPASFDERQTLSEPGNGMGFASSPFEPLSEPQQNQRWVF
jgi:hypothetical protein